MIDVVVAAVVVACSLVLVSGGQAPYIVMVRDLPDPRNPEASEVRALLTSAPFQAALPTLDPFTNDELIPRCAVVGNAPTILGSNFGAEIDAHDAVFRLNFPLVRGFERDVGRKTTHMFSNQRWGGFNAGRPDVSTVDDFINLVYVVELNAFPALERFLATLEHPPPGLRAYVLSAFVGSTMYRYLNDISSRAGVVPSTGFYAAVAAMLRCRSVDLYAFGDAAKSNKNHYWSNDNVAGDNVYDKHTYPVEEFVFRAAELGAWLVPNDMLRLMRVKPQVKLHLVDAFEYCYDDYLKAAPVEALNNEALNKLFHRKNCAKPVDDAVAEHMHLHPDPVPAIPPPPPPPPQTQQEAKVEEEQHHHHEQPAVVATPMTTVVEEVAHRKDHKDDDDDDDGSDSDEEEDEEEDRHEKKKTKKPKKTKAPKEAKPPKEEKAAESKSKSKEKTAAAATEGPELVRPTAKFELMRIHDVLAPCSAEEIHARLHECDTQAEQCLMSAALTVGTVCSCVDSWTYCHIAARCGFSIEDACKRIGCVPIDCTDPSRAPTDEVKLLFALGNNNAFAGEAAPGAKNNIESHLNNRSASLTVVYVVVVIGVLAAVTLWTRQWRQFAQPLLQTFGKTPIIGGIIHRLVDGRRTERTVAPTDSEETSSGVDV